MLPKRLTTFTKPQLMTAPTWLSNIIKYPSMTLILLFSIYSSLKIITVVIWWDFMGYRSDMGRIFISRMRRFSRISILGFWKRLRTRNFTLTRNSPGPNFRSTHTTWFLTIIIETCKHSSKMIWFLITYKLLTWLYSCFISANICTPMINPGASEWSIFRRYTGLYQWFYHIWDKIPVAIS